jgi:superoxide dismutase, Fe-Mn family
MFILPKLNFKPENLEPAISAATISFHHGKHHQTYINKLNELVQANIELQGKTLDQLIQEYKHLPDSIQLPVLNNAGQVYNHNLYWESITDDKNQTPSNSFTEILNQNFGSVEEFKSLIEAAGLAQFGSGWAWLSVDNVSKKLVVSKTSNAESPLLFNQTPIFTIDVWEHAYYLGYQNRRGDYLKDMWNIVNWSEIERKYLELI